MKPLFEEQQRYSQKWLWLIVVSVAVANIGSVVFAMYTQYILKKPWGNEPMSDEGLLYYSFIMLTIMVGLIFLFLNMVMETVVDRGGIAYRYFPLIRNWRRVEREDISHAEIKKYILKGHGVKRDLKGNRSINVKGPMGIELTLGNGKKLFLGTQKPGEFLDAVHKMKKGRTD